MGWVHRVSKVKLIDSPYRMAFGGIQQLFLQSSVGSIDLSRERVLLLKKSKLLQNALINSNSKAFHNFSKNSSQGVLADVDTLILDIKQDLDKLKFAMPGRYKITLPLTKV